MVTLSLQPQTSLDPHLGTLFGGFISLILSILRGYWTYLCTQIPMNPAVMASENWAWTSRRLLNTFRPYMSKQNLGAPPHIDPTRIDLNVFLASMTGYMFDTDDKTTFLEAYKDSTCLLHTTERIFIHVDITHVAAAPPLFMNIKKFLSSLALKAIDFPSAVRLDVIFNAPRDSVSSIETFMREAQQTPPQSRYSGRHAGLRHWRLLPMGVVSPSPVSVNNNLPHHPTFLHQDHRFILRIQPIPS
ncbi:hypothetical protein PTTW11_07490 [Pyrenophora teres f. teres]|uniref:Uncharacterized protein n=1 Tax=Pyrenophora teres f. teres TaxID=97479 RepID=A0A6S6W6Y0_9PLEO|nr:hypothetical protein PTTW11_07490 [Pyrenophora teres f. teres]